jgi:hypothetical protein
MSYVGRYLLKPLRSILPSRKAWRGTYKASTTPPRPPGNLRAVERLAHDTGACNSDLESVHRSVSWTRRNYIDRLASHYATPAIYFFHEFSGALISYGTNLRREFFAV